MIPRAEHGISRSAISPNALKVLYRLHSAGFSAYLVGGCVRDLLLGRRPKDFDIATNALPEEVRKLFRNCRLIGKRFRLAHIVFGKDIIEVATFRTHHKEGHEKHGHTRHGMIVRDNVYGTIEDDAWRRDFSINALYYNIADFSILDYTGGIADLKKHTLRMIGNPEQRFHEDPVRLLRAIRFMGKLDLKLDPETEAPMLGLSHLLQNVSPARLFQEILKFFQEGATLPTFKLLCKYRLFASLFPQAAALSSDPINKKLLEESLTVTDQRVQAGKSVSPAFILATFAWRPTLKLVEDYLQEKIPAHAAYDKALRTVLREQTETLTIPKTLQVSIHEICFLQYRLTCRYGSAPFRLLDHPRFRAAYDLLVLRANAGEPVAELSEWWTQFQAGSHEQRATLLKNISNTQPKKRRRPNRRRRSNKNTQKASNTI